jgi:hypothetical protein
MIIFMITSMIIQVDSHTPRTRQYTYTRHGYVFESPYTQETDSHVCHCAAAEQMCSYEFESGVGKSYWGGKGPQFTSNCAATSLNLEWGTAIGEVRAYNSLTSKCAATSFNLEWGAAIGEVRAYNFNYKQLCSYEFGLGRSYWGGKGPQFTSKCAATSFNLEWGRAIGEVRAYNSLTSKCAATILEWDTVIIMTNCSTFTLCDKLHCFRMGNWTKYYPSWT